MRTYAAEFEMVMEKDGESVDAFKLGRLTTTNLFPSGYDGEMKVDGSRLSISCSAPTKEDAHERTTALAVRFARLVSMKTGQHFTTRFTGLDSVPSERGQTIFAPFPVTIWIDDYDVETKFLDDVQASALAASFADQTLDRAATYFHRGLFYRRVVWREISPHWPDYGFTVAEATLNFYKAVAVILGDDAGGQRSNALGVDRALRTRIDHLYRRRSWHDVAHPTLDAHAIRQQLLNTVVGSQQIAHAVIELYAAFLQTGRVLPAAGPARRPPRRNKSV